MNPYELRQKFQNLATSKTPWYKIVNQADGPTQIHMFNVIGGLGIPAEEFLGELDGITGPIELRINSEGGEVYPAKLIYNALSRLPDVSVIVDGLAASAASFIAMAASPGKLYMSKIATMMIHDGFTIAAGSAKDLRQLADVLDKESDIISGIYAERSGKDATYFREKMKTETWYSAQQALDEGLCDGIFDARSGKIMNVANAASVPWVSERQTRHEPMTGRHSHDHSAGGADDHDDGQHAHYHTHAGDADHHNHAHDDSNSDHHPNMSDSAEGVVLASAFPDAQFYNRTFTTEERKSLAKKGHALPDGSYPIENCEDAMNAREAYGRAPEGKRSAVAAHIKKRESALSCKHEPFKPGSGNTSDLVITDEDVKAAAASFASMIRL